MPRASRAPKRPRLALVREDDTARLPIGPAPLLPRRGAVRQVQSPAGVLRLHALLEPPEDEAYPMAAVCIAAVELCPSVDREGVSAAIELLYQLLDKHPQAKSRGKLEVMR